MSGRSTASRSACRSLAVAIVVLAASARLSLADDCGSLGGSIVGCECQVSGVVQRTGTYNLDETLHVLAAGSIDAKGAAGVGITLNVNGTGSCGGDVLLDSGAQIRANDDVVPVNSNASASPITINASGNVDLQSGAAIRAENATGTGTGGAITITANDVLLHGTATTGAVISSSFTGGANAGAAASRTPGPLAINARGRIVLEPNTIVAANSAGGPAGPIHLTADGTIDVDGLVAAGPSTTVLATKLTGKVLGGGNTSQQGGTIDIVSHSRHQPALTVTPAGIVVSQGQDPSSDVVHLEGCGIVIDGLVVSTSDKSNGSTTNRPVVIVRSGTTLAVEGQDLAGSGGTRRGRVRADYQVGEHHLANRVDLFAKNDIAIGGPASGLVFAVSADGGSATNQTGGAINVISLEGTVTATGKALQASGLASGSMTPGGGSNGGSILAWAHGDVTLNGATLEAVGDYNVTGGLGIGGTIAARSYSAALSWTTGTGDVRPTGAGVPAANRGTATLTYCTMATVGASFPATGLTPPPPDTQMDCSDPAGPPAASVGEPLPSCVCEPPNCDDESACTADSCVEGQCQHVAVSCDDGNSCTTDSCNPTVGCVHVAVDCSDGLDCTIDTCVPGEGCVHQPSDSACDDGNPCTDDACDPATPGGCIHHPHSCEDNNPCTDDSCDPTVPGGCVHAPHACDDGNSCTTDTCDPTVAGGCVHVTPGCDDGNPCTDDTCNPTTPGGCIHQPHSCDDNNPCTDDSCDPTVAGGCVHTSHSCDDNNPCTDDSCDPTVVGGCVHSPHSCDDGIACTTDTCDRTIPGGCVHAPPPSCDDGNPCTNDVRDAAGCCLHVPNSNPCNDGNACTTSDTCANGACVGGPGPSCNDGNACTTDSCDPATGCVHGTVNCNDSNACTVDTCSQTTGCVHTNMNCDDSNACTTDSCLNGVCQHAAINCSDNDSCTTDTCANGVCSHAPMNCDDGNSCTTDTCVAGACQHAGTCPPPGCGLFYAPDYLDHNVYMYAANGTPAGTFHLISANFNAGGTGGPVNNLVYILDRIDNRVYRYTATGASTGTFQGMSRLLRRMNGTALSGGGTRPSGLSVDGDDMWVLSPTPDGVLLRYSVAAAFAGTGNINALQEIVMPNSLGGNDGKGLAIDGTFLYVANDGADQIVRYRRDGTGSPLASPTLRHANGVGWSEVEGATICGTSLFAVESNAPRVIMQYPLATLFTVGGNAASEFPLASTQTAPRGL